MNRIKTQADLLPPLQTALIIILIFLLYLSVSIYPAVRPDLSYQKVDKGFLTQAVILSACCAHEGKTNADESA